jgi:hypothetical protein
VLKKTLTFRGAGMSNMHDLTTWLYGDVRTDRGFWYSHPLYEINGLTEDQLFWIPNENCLCLLWQAGHIAHRERYHIGRFLQGMEDDIIPARYDVFGTEWCSVDELRQSIDSIDDVCAWIENVRQQSLDYISSIPDESWHHVPPASEFGLTVAHWLFITVSHGTLHIGKMQLLRAMLEGKRDRPC